METMFSTLFFSKIIFIIWFNTGGHLKVIYVNGVVKAPVMLICWLTQNICIMYITWRRPEFNTGRWCLCSTLSKWPWQRHTSGCSPSSKKNRVGTLALIRHPVKEKENFKFKTALPKNIDKTLLILTSIIIHLPNSGCFFYRVKLKLSVQ